jgi:cell division septation protein DedD
VAPAAPRPIAPAPAVAAPRPIVAAAVKPSPVPVAAAKPAPAPAPAAEATPAAKTKGKFTLQLSTFASVDEANAFAQRYPGAFVISGEVPGRGIAHRVRYGNFPTYKDATAAKESFEKQHGTIALVAAR